MKIALACMVRNENHYLREYVEHYLGIGVDKFVLVDNNDVDGENPADVLPEYFSNGVVQSIDKRGAEFRIAKYLQEAYDMLSSEVDWVGLVDPDEFVIFSDKGENIKSYLGKPMFDDAGVVRLQWKLFDDNDLVSVENEDYSQVKRFTRPIGPENAAYYANTCTKAFLRADMGFTHVHEHGTYENAVCRNANGEKCINAERLPYHLKNPAAWINHYRTKTVQEFVERRVSDSKWGYPGFRANQLDYFFTVNKDTPEKRRIADSLLSERRSQNVN